MPVYAVETFKVSDYGSGTQIWFEVEHFDERNPDDDSSFALSDEPGAYDRSINSLSGDAGATMIRYTFNIGAAGGKGGTWYFWGRVINPSNQSDFMLVDGHPGDQTPVTTLPVSDLVNGQRVFEENAGSTGNWAWSGDNHNEGHTKELQDGENTMWILSRQTGAIWDVMMWTDDAGYTPTDADYENAIPGGGFGPASRPEPADGALIAETWISLLWRPGDFAVSHDVYLGENFDDVSDGTVDTFRGNHSDNNFVAGFPGFPYPDGLVPGTTYYWRVDEVNEADPNSPWRGDVWSFWIPPTSAYEASPFDAAQYVDTDVTLSWAPGFGAKLHTVFFGDNFDDVNNAVAGIPQADATYAPGTLELDKTYYWRVDEFNPPTTVKGDVWSFTTPPVIPIGDPDLIGWWKLDEGHGDTALDWSGHGNNGTIGGDPEWVDGILNGALDLASDYVVIDGVVDDITGTDITLSIWIKSTQTGQGDLFAANDSASAHPLEFYIEGGRPGRYDGSDTTYSAAPLVADGQWHMMTYVRSGNTGYIYVDGVEVATDVASFDLSTVTRWSIGQEWDDASPSNFHTGMVDDARFYNKALTAEQIAEVMRGDPKLAGSPVPDRDAIVDIRDISSLSWSRGDTAASHDVYFGADRDAVANADNSAPQFQGNQAGTSLSLAGLVEFGGGDYYWRIDEVEGDGTVNTGAIWKFTVPDYLIVDDIESYNDLAEDDPASNRVYLAWIDGFGTTTNGAVVGNLDVPLTERGNVHGGLQAMPYSYDNNLKTSEATLTLARRDWTAEGVTKLSLWFRGDGANVAERMFVALNGSAVVYHDDASVAQTTGWTEWVIDLTEFAGVDMTNVTTITIGFGTKGSPAAGGGTGTMYFDDIRLIR